MAIVNRAVSQRPPRIVLLHGLVPWASTRLIIVPVYLAISYLTFHNAIGLVIVLPYAILYWIEPSMRQMEALAQSLRRSPKRVSISKLLPLPLISLGIAMISLLQGTILEIFAYLLIYHSLLWGVYLTLFSWNRIGIAHVLSRLYPWIYWPTIILLPNFSRFLILNALIMAFVGIAWSVFLEEYAAKDPILERLREEYQAALFDNRESLSLASARTEESANARGLRIVRRPLIVQDQKKLYSCTPLSNGKITFAVIDCQSSNFVKPNSTVRRILWFADYMRTSKRSRKSDHVFALFTPIMDSFLEHHAQWAREDGGPYGMHIYRKIRPESMILGDMLIFWKWSRRYVKYSLDSPSTTVHDEILRKLREVHDTIKLRTQQISSLPDMRVATLAYLKEISQFLAIIENSSAEIESLIPERTVTRAFNIK